MQSVPAMRPNRAKCPFTWRRRLDAGRRNQSKRTGDDQPGRTTSIHGPHRVKTLSTSSPPQRHSRREPVSVRPPSLFRALNILPACSSFVSQQTGSGSASTEDHLFPVGTSCAGSKRRCGKTGRRMTSPSKMAATRRSQALVRTRGCRCGRRRCSFITYLAAPIELKSFQVKVLCPTFDKAGVKRELLDSVKARKLAYYGHT